MVELKTVLAAIADPNTSAEHRRMLKEIADHLHRTGSTVPVGKSQGTEVPPNTDVVVLPVGMPRP